MLRTDQHWNIRHFDNYSHPRSQTDSHLFQSLKMSRTWKGKAVILLRNQLVTLFTKSNNINQIDIKSSSTDLISNFGKITRRKFILSFASPVADPGFSWGVWMSPTLDFFPKWSRTFIEFSEFREFDNCSLSQVSCWHCGSILVSYRRGDTLESF